MESSTRMIVMEKVVGKHQEKTVDARELHAFLGVGRRFTTWIQSRIKQWGFKEGKDYVILDSPVLGSKDDKGNVCFPVLGSKESATNVCSPVLASKGRGGHNATEYALTLDMAKHLSMVERTQRGYEAREYFIECERRYKESLKPVKVAPRITANPDEIASYLRLYDAYVIAHKAHGLSHIQSVFGAKTMMMRNHGFDIDPYVVMGTAEGLTRAAYDVNRRENRDETFWYPDAEGKKH